MSVEKVGIQCKLLYDATPGAVSGKNEISLVRDVTLNCTAGDIDVTSRANSGWRAKRAGLKEWDASFDMIYSSDDGGWQALRKAFVDGTAIGISILDGLSGKGVNGSCYVTDFGRGEPMNDVVTTKVKLVGAGAPTLTPES